MLFLKKKVERGEKEKSTSWFVASITYKVVLKKNREGDFFLVFRLAKINKIISLDPKQTLEKFEGKKCLRKQTILLQLILCVKRLLCYFKNLGLTVINSI